MPKKTFNVIYSETLIYSKQIKAKNQKEAEALANAEIQSESFDLGNWRFRDVFESRIDDVSEIKKEV
jgi:hypothetical protein